MCRAVARLPSPPDLALVDGNMPPALTCAGALRGWGDARCLSIAAASIVAVRDRAMARLAVRWPGYGWRPMSATPPEHHRAALLRLSPRVTTGRASPVLRNWPADLASN